MRCLHDPMLSRFDTISACVGLTYNCRHTDTCAGHLVIICGPSIAATQTMLILSSAFVVDSRKIRVLLRTYHILLALWRLPVDRWPAVLECADQMEINLDLEDRGGAMVSRHHSPPTIASEHTAMFEPCRPVESHSRAWGKHSCGALSQSHSD